MMIPVGGDLTSRSSAYQPLPVGMTMGGMSIMMQEMYGGRGVVENGGLVIVEDVGSSVVEGSTTTTEMEEEDSVFLHGVVQYQQQPQPPPVLARQQQQIEMGCARGGGEGTLMEGSSSMMGMMMVDPVVDGDWLVASTSCTTATAAAPWKLQPCLDEFSPGVGCGLVVSQPGVRDNKKKRRVQEDVVDDKAAIQRQKRMIKNRESAARSRERKQIYIEDLERVARQLKEENARLERQMETERERLKKLQEFESKCQWLLDRPAEDGRSPPRRLRRSSTL